jgi:hypothetical protein
LILRLLSPSLALTLTPLQLVWEWLHVSHTLLILV